MGNRPASSDESAFGPFGASGYETLYEFTPFGMETPPPECSHTFAPAADAPPAPRARLPGIVIPPTLADLSRRLSSRFFRRLRRASLRLYRKSRRLHQEQRRGTFWTSLPLPGWLRRPALSPAELAALRRRRRRRALVELAVWMGLAAAMIALVTASLVAYYAMALPDPRLAGLTRKPPNITIRSVGGEFLAERGMRRGYVPLDQAPRHLIDAVIATEDRRFRRHYGFDPIGLVRAAYVNWRSGGVVQGGSTLTQQLAKNLFLQPRRHWTRKFEELILSLWLETKFSKDEIIELYLNRVYFGAGAYGIEAAAHHYFGKPARELTLPESAMLTGLIKAPSSLSPTHNPEAAEDRAALVLKCMLEERFITDREHRHALGHPAQIHVKAQTPGFDYLVDWITELAPSLVGEAEGNFTVETTIDFRLQQDADVILRQKMVERGRDLQAGEAALVLLAPDGAVKALVGGLDYDSSQFNRAVKGKRQPGSAFKPVLYLAALEAGMTPDTLVDDAPIETGVWRPQNFGGAYRGMIPLRTALAVSSNTAAVRIMDQVGARAVIDAAQRLGVYSNLERGPTIALGAAEVTPLELTAAYAAFANGGYPALPYVIERVRDESSAILYEQSHARPEPVISADHVSAMNDMLNAVVVSGAGHRAALARHQVCGKTGTTQRFNDAWFVGYTGHWVAGVWVGNDRRMQMRRVTGGSLPAEIWRDVMTRAHEGLKPRPLPGVGSGRREENAGRRDENAATPAKRETPVLPGEVKKAPEAPVLMQSDRT